MPERHEQLYGPHHGQRCGAHEAGGQAAERSGPGGAHPLQRPPPLDGRRQRLLPGAGPGHRPGHGGGLPHPLHHPLSHLGQRGGEDGAWVGLLRRGPHGLALLPDESGLPADGLAGFGVPPGYGRFLRHLPRGHNQRVLCGGRGLFRRRSPGAGSEVSGFPVLTVLLEESIPLWRVTHPCRGAHCAPARQQDYFDRR